MKYQWFQLSITDENCAPGVFVIEQGEGSYEGAEIVISHHQLPDLIRALQAIEAEFRAATSKGHLDRLRDDLRA